jgi:hypothetical protein
MFKLPHFSGRTIIMILGLGLFLTAMIGISLRQQEVAVANPTVNLMRPGGDTIAFTQDTTDTSMSKIQDGELVYPAEFNGDVRDLPQVGPTEKTLNVEFERPEDEKSDPSFIDPVAQTFDAPEAMPSPSQNFAGLDLNNWGAGWPPDTHGDVGPNHYVQAVNTSIGIYSKTGTQLAAFTFDTLFAGTGTPCDADNNGDPVVLYDNVSGRWIITDFAWTNTQNGPYYECIAVSQTADPVSGGWYFYGLRADDATHPWLNDYPKLGVWHDGIYMTANMFDCLTSTCSSASYKGVRIWALNRDSLVNGQPLSYQYADLGSAYFSLVPANAKVTQAPAGTPNYMMSLQNTSTMYTWKLSIDWNNSANSTLTGPVATTIASYSNAAAVPQLGTSVTLDSLAGRLMVQLQYSNVGGNPALWVTHSVSTSSRAGIRWYEFRNLSGTPSVFQQGTYSPDATHRWMGSVAVDSQGNMAVGYSASSSSINPQIRYAGRLAGDALGTLGQGEATLISGTGSQTSYTRWGDYSSMTVDVDGCTFWYTTEYYITTGTNWQTRIGSFSFPGCSGGPTPTPGPTNTPTATPTNTPTPTPTNTPIPGSGATIYVSSSTNGTAGGVSFADEDVLSYNTGSATWSMYFDGSDVGITGDVDAFDLQSDGTILMSFDAAVSVTGLGSVADADIVRFTPTSLGSTTAGTFSWYFDGSDVGLTTTNEDVDAIGFAPDGRLLISTNGSPGVTGLSGLTDEDLIAFTPTSLGSTTAGTWGYYFDGSDVGLSTSSSEDTNGVWVDNATNDLYLTVLGAFSVTGVSGDGADIFICDPGTLGSTTTCTFSMYWDGSLFGFAGEVADGIDIVP